MNKIIVFSVVIFAISMRLALAFEEHAAAVSFNNLKDNFIKKADFVYNSFGPAVKTIKSSSKAIFFSSRISEVPAVIKNSFADKVNIPKLINVTHDNNGAGFDYPRLSFSVSSSVSGILKPFSDFVGYLKNLIYPKAHAGDAAFNNASLLPANKSVNRAYEDSPFGISGAYSRPYISGDNASREEIQDKLIGLEDPYKNVKDVGAKWVRPGIDITWPLVQHSRKDIQEGSFDWSITDKLYGNVPDGVNILATIGVGQGVKEGNWQFVDKEAEKAYISYVSAVVERYDGDGKKDMPGLKNPIKYWQIENEPVFIKGRPGPDGNTYNLDWQGFSYLGAITCGVIKEKDPQAQVAIGGMAFGHLVNSKNQEAGRYKKEVENFYVPLINDLQSNCADVFDIHYYGNFGAAQAEYKGMKDVYLGIRAALDKAGFRNTKIWFTETGSPSKPNGEKAQASELVKRFIYPISFGAGKIFWWNMIEGEAPLEKDKPNNHFGLVYDGVGAGDPGYGGKKLAYYSYKKMVEVLEGSDWSSIQTLQSAENTFVYKLNKANQSIWVAWSENGADRQIQIGGINSSRINITESVPKYESGKEVKNYYNAFTTETKTVNNRSVTLDVGKVPVFITED